MTACLAANLTALTLCANSFFLPIRTFRVTDYAQVIAATHVASGAENAIDCSDDPLDPPRVLRFVVKSTVDGDEYHFTLTGDDLGRRVFCNLEAFIEEGLMRDAYVEVTFRIAPQVQKFEPHVVDFRWDNPSTSPKRRR